MQTAGIALLLASLMSLRTVLSETNPVVEAPAGRFRGHIVQTRDGRDVLAFQGIPYALPPVGKLRFKESVKMPRLRETLTATDDTRDCYQPVFDFTRLANLTQYKGSEDCLYLNVYVPKMDKTESKLPVFVWIHGGGYFMASGSSYYNGPEYFLDKHMILVTVNYRLGVLGFLSTGDRVLPGNLGMKDQVLALRWVRDNVASFGGDPSSVTVGGESAGSASVTQHMHSELSRGLFHRCIAQSGSLDSLWATQKSSDAHHTALKYSAQVGCPIEQNKFIQCLQSKTLQQLFDAADAIKEPMGVLSMEFVPVVERESPAAFITEASLRSDSHLPLIIGVTSHESLAMPAFLSAVNPKYRAISGIMEDYEKLFPVTLYYKARPDSGQLTKRLVDFYFGADAKNSATNLQLINLFGDVMFTHPVWTRARKHKGSTYLYMFSYKGQVASSPVTPETVTEGVSHSEDLLYMFNFDFIPHGPLSGEDRAMSDKVVQLWYDFIRTGNPTPESKLWEESENGVKYLDFTNNGLIMKTDMYDERMRFLDILNIHSRDSPRHDEL